MSALGGNARVGHADEVAGEDVAGEEDLADGRGDADGIFKGPGVNGAFHGDERHVEHRREHRGQGCYDVGSEEAVERRVGHFRNDGADLVAPLVEHQEEADSEGGAKEGAVRAATQIANDEAELGNGAQRRELKVDELIVAGGVIARSYHQAEGEGNENERGEDEQEEERRIVEGDGVGEGEGGTEEGEGEGHAGVDRGQREDVVGGGRGGEG